MTTQIAYDALPRTTGSLMGQFFETGVDDAGDMDAADFAAGRALFLLPVELQPGEGLIFDYTLVVSTVAPEGVPLGGDIRYERIQGVVRRNHDGSFDLNNNVSIATSFLPNILFIDVIPLTNADEFGIVLDLDPSPPYSAVRAAAKVNHRARFTL
jgi:hypothetical protein